MYRFLEKLRKSDRIKRDSFAFFVSFGITFFIFSIWLFNLIYDLKTDQVENTASPISAFSNQVKNLFNSRVIYDAEK